VAELRLVRMAVRDLLASLCERHIMATDLDSTSFEQHVTLRTRDRPLLPVEDCEGWGVFNRLAVLPDLPLSSIWELSSLAKNHRLGRRDPRGVRSPIEVWSAIFHALTGPIWPEVQAVVGHFELQVANGTWRWPADSALFRSSCT
jgi:hypothetical protein